MVNDSQKKTSCQRSPWTWSTMDQDWRFNTRWTFHSFHIAIIYNLTVYIWRIDRYIDPLPLSQLLWRGDSRNKCNLFRWCALSHHYLSRIMYLWIWWYTSMCVTSATSASLHVCDSTNSRKGTCCVNVRKKKKLIVYTVCM